MTGVDREVPDEAAGCSDPLESSLGDPGFDPVEVVHECPERLPPHPAQTVLPRAPGPASAASLEASRIATGERSTPVARSAPREADASVSPPSPQPTSSTVLPAIRCRPRRSRRVLERPRTDPGRARRPLALAHLSKHWATPSGSAEVIPS